MCLSAWRITNEFTLLVHNFVQVSVYWYRLKNWYRYWLKKGYRFRSKRWYWYSSTLDNLTIFQTIRSCFKFKVMFYFDQPQGIIYSLWILLYFLYNLSEVITNSKMLKRIIKLSLYMVRLNKVMCISQKLMCNILK